MPKPSKQIIVDAIVKEIELGKDRAYVIAKFCKKFQKSTRTVDTYWKTANEQQKKRADKASKAADIAYIETRVEAVKSGLKSKLERQLDLQKGIEQIMADIERGILEDYFVISGKVQVVNKKMNAESKAYLWKTIKELTAELTKTEGDYPAAQVGHTFNNPLPLTATKEEIKKIANALDNSI